MLALKLAVRFLKSGRGQTVLIIAGIGVAVAAQIFVGLLISSLQKTLVDRTIGGQPQITVSSATDEVTIADRQSVVDTIKSSGLVNTVTTTADGNAFIRKGEKTYPVIVRGFDSEADSIYRISDAMYLGDWSRNDDEIIVGRDLYDELGISIGDGIEVNSPLGGTAMFPVTGVFDLGVGQLNETWIITNLKTSQSLFGYGDGVTAVELTVDDLFAADTIAETIESRLDNDSLTVSNWKAENSQLLSGLQGQSISSLMIQIFIIVSVVIAIAAILAITVFQKSRQLGILKAMGIKDRAASLIFIYEGLIIGLISSFIGVGLGLFLLYGFSFGTSQPDSPALIDLYIDYKFIVLSWFIAVLAAVLAALIPARRSLRLNPIEVIREG